MHFFSRILDRANPVGQTEHRSIGSEPVRSRRRASVPTNAGSILEHHPVREHAERFLAWLQENDLAGGMIFHHAIVELYAEMVIELGWAERSWNPIARQLDLICTGGRKPYEWASTPTGRKHRLRVYPIPSGAPTAQALGPNVLKLRPVA